MSLASKEPTITLWRRTECSDVHEIKALVKDPQTKELFGDIDVATVIEKSYLSICQENSIGHIVSNISLCDHPNVPAVPPCQWIHWVKKIYRMERVTEQNTLFVHLLVWNPHYSNEFLKLLLETIFINNYFLQYILLVVPPGAPTADILDEHFTRLMPWNETDCVQVQTLLICMRLHHMPRLKIRPALEEDNDDLIPILDQQNKDLRQLYGEFYIAEMVAYPDNGRKMVVAEHADRAIGVMSMSKNVNFDLLNLHFEIAPYHGLRKPHENDDVHSKQETRADSIEGLRLPLVIRSCDSLSKLSILSTLFDLETEALLNELYDSARVSLSPSVDTLVFDELSIISFQEDMFEFLDGSIEEKQPLRFSRVSILDSTEQAFTFSEKSLIEQASSMYKVQGLKIPVYHGWPNAFMVELFALNENWDERLSADFLEAAFECYPDLDYCIITIPSTYPVFPLLEHFVRVVPRPLREFTHELYVCHRNSILSEIKVRMATCEDFTAVQSLLGNIIGRKQIEDDFSSAVNEVDSIFQAYILLSEDNVVGLAIVIAEDDILYLQSNYNIEAYVDLKLHINDSHGILKHFTMSPIFINHVRYFLREVHRLSDYNCLYYLLYSSDIAMVHDRSLITALSAMIPILPRRQIKYDTKVLEENIPCQSILRKELPFALYHMNKRYCSLPKISINTRIVVVGASKTATSFLETLLFSTSSTYLTFNNITLVSPHGLPGITDSTKLHHKLLTQQGHYTNEYLTKLNLRTYVNLIYGIMTNINRDEKFIVINEEAIIQYDYLMLFVGEQYQMPLTTAPSELKKCVHGKRKIVDDVEIPQNVFYINTEIDASNALTALKRFTRHRDHPHVIVYGKCLEAYNCVAVLQEFGISNTKICFIEPLGDTVPRISVFNDNQVDEAVMNCMKDNKIEVYSGYFFVEWKYDSSEHKIISARFDAKTKSLNIECAAMFYYGNKSVSRHTFLAFERGKLVFDGRLVINPNFCTSDKFIYAAGPFTKYARRYHAERYTHCYYNREEIGKVVAKQMLKIWDPTEETCDINDQVPPLFEQSLIHYSLLPGNMKYIKIEKPGFTVPLEAAMNQDDYGIALVTGDCKNTTSHDYFRIHLNISNRVETITCYTKNEINVDNLSALYGLHEHVLNNLINRFERGYISDFYSYFCEPWCYVLLHDRFREFSENIKEVFTFPLKNNPFSCILDEIRKQFRMNNWKKMNNNKFEEFKDIYKSQYREEIEDRLLWFFTNNSYHLPMYAYPEIVKMILQDSENSPLFIEAEEVDTSSDSSEETSD